MLLKRSFLLALIALAFPVGAFAAQLQVSEIMYNPAGSDTGREWIEVYNPGTSDVALVGGSGKNSWRVADGSNHTIVDPSGGTGRGSLTVPAGGYLIIASDPTAFISGEFAGGTYSVAKSSISLSNTGASVSLIDGSGTTVDSITYSKDQGAYDDGASLQRQASGTWIAGLPTPGAANTSTAVVAQTTDTSSSTTNSNATSTSSEATTQTQNTVSSYVAPPQPLVFADGGDNRTVIVGADTAFRGRAYDRKSQPVDHVRFSWNFGDGTTAEGASVLHHYVYPGRYAAVLNVADQTDSESDHFIVTAIPAELSFRVEADGSIAIQNDDIRDLDLSGWIVRSFVRTFTLPAETVVLKGEVLRIGHEALGFFADPNTDLEYPNGVHALAANQIIEQPAPPRTSTAQVASEPQAPPQTRAASSKTIPQMDDPETAVEMPDAASSLATSSGLAAAAASAWQFSPWWLAALGIAVAAALGVAVARRMRKGEWDIVEESE